MSFNLTPTITINSQEELDAAIVELSTETDSEWLAILRERGQRHLSGAVEEVEFTVDSEEEIT